MNSDTIISKLNEVIHLDIDAWHAYDLVVQKVPKGEISSNLASFQADHMRHVEDMSTLVTKYGGTPPKFARDFKGFMISGMAMASTVSARTMMSAMSTNEKLTNKTYENVVQWATGTEPGAGTGTAAPDDVRKLVEGGWEDEKRHIRWINESIEREAWNREPVWPTE